MEPSLIATIVQTIGEIRALIELVSSVYSPFKNNKKELGELKRKIEFLEGETRRTFPQLAQLIRSYSSLLSDVKVVKAISDNSSQIIQKAPNTAPLFIEYFISQIEDKHAQIRNSARQLPQIEVPELGKMDAQLQIITDRILIIKNRTEEQDIERFRSDFRDISTHYANLQDILSQLLERILKSFET